MVNKGGFVIAALMLLAVVLAGCSPADVVRAGEGTLELTLTLPDGYHLNSGTVSRVSWEVDGVVVATDAERDIDLLTLDDPLRLPVTFSEGKADAIAHLDVKYCSDDETQCFIETQDLKVPVEVAASGSRSVLAAEWAIKPQEF